MRSIWMQSPSNRKRKRLKDMKETSSQTHVCDLIPVQYPAARVIQNALCRGARPPDCPLSGGISRGSLVPDVYLFDVFPGIR